MRVVALVLFVIFYNINLYSANVKVFPETCTELLPEYSDYIEYLEDLGALWSYSSRFYAKKVFKLLALRDLYQQENLDQINPINSKIRTLLCKCRSKISTKIVTASSYDMKQCLKKNIDMTIKNALFLYKELKTKKALLSKSHKDRMKYEKIIRYLKRAAIQEIQNSI